MPFVVFIFETGVVICIYSVKIIVCDMRVQYNTDRNIKFVTEV